MADDTAATPLNAEQVLQLKGQLQLAERYPGVLAPTLAQIRVLLATIDQRDATIAELRARVKELEDRVTSWEQDALRGSTGLAAWDWG